MGGAMDLVAAPGTKTIITMVSVSTIQDSHNLKMTRKLKT